jgi:signal transduction histidine kinase
MGMKATNKHIPFDKHDIKILVVDDREDNLLSIETILDKDGYNIIKANSGRAALKILLHETDFTLILMDVQMPDMNGFETATLIYQRDKLKDIPIIFITAHDAGEENLFKGYKMGAVDFLFKPVNAELLRFKVSVFAELYRKNRQLVQQEKKLKDVNAYLEKEIEERKSTEDKIKRLNQQLFTNNLQLKSTVEELDRFAFVASHDLQEPLRKIQLFTDKIQKRAQAELTEETASYFNKITKASERMQLLINDLLKFSRDTNDVHAFEQINLNLIVKDVLSDVEAEIEKKNAKVVSDNLPVIWGVPSQVRQLFQNLISNALKFCKDGCVPQIHIQSQKIPGTQLTGIDQSFKHHNYYKISVRDNGIGFDPKYSDEIFVVFKRLHSYHEFEGTGIGLSICKKIVEKHHGYISATSILNEGSVFTVTLPEKALLV